MGQYLLADPLASHRDQRCPGRSRGRIDSFRQRNAIDREAAVRGPPRRVEFSLQGTRDGCVASVVSPRSAYVVSRFAGPYVYLGRPHGSSSGAGGYGARCPGRRSVRHVVLGSPYKPTRRPRVPTPRSRLAWTSSPCYSAPPPSAYRGAHGRSEASGARAVSSPIPACALDRSTGGATREATGRGCRWMSAVRRQSR